jgi:DNA-directed RNA polymerase subunit RPC12/RpoP
MKRGLIIGISKLYSIRDEVFLVYCGECDNLFHIQKTEKRDKIKCPLCRNEIELIRRDKNEE